MSVLSAMTAERSAAPHRATILDVLRRCLSPANAEVILASALRQAGMTDSALERQGLDSALLQNLQRGVRLFCRDRERAAACHGALNSLLGRQGASEPSDLGPVVIPIEDEEGVVNARSQARAMCGRIGFGSTEQLKVATAVSELARNIQRYVGRGKVTLKVLNDGKPGIEIVAEDDGSGIPHLDSVLSGRYVSKTGLGLGIRGCQRLMDTFEIDTERDRGTKIVARKYR